MSAECPRCGASETEPVIYEAWAWPLVRQRRALVAAGDPAPPSEDLESPNHRCRACGHEWPDPERIHAAHEIHVQIRPDPLPGETGA